MNVLADLADTLDIPHSAVGIRATRETSQQHNEPTSKGPKTAADEETEFRPALARLRAEIRKRRIDRGWSQRRLASHMTYSFQYVSQAERHGANLPSADLVAELDEVLQSEGELNSLLFEAQQECGSIRKLHAETDISEQTAWSMSQIIRAVTKSTNADLTLSRREALSGASAIWTGAKLTQPLQSWLAPIDPVNHRPNPRPRREFAEEELDELAALVAHFKRMSRSGSGLLARKSVIAQLNGLSERLERAIREDKSARRAMLISADLAEIAATASWDAGLHRSAQKYYVTAVQLTKIAGADEAAALVLASLARQCYDLKQPDDGLEIVQMALYGIRKVGSPIVRSMLATREAWAYAQQGHSRRFRRAVGLAEDYFEESCASGIDCIGGFDCAELNGVIGARYRDLALHDPTQVVHAVSYIERALQFREPSRVQNRAFDTIGLARAYLIDRQFEQSSRLIRETMAVAQPWLTGRVGRKLSDFCSEAELFAKDSSELRHTCELVTTMLRKQQGS